MCTHTHTLITSLKRCHYPHFTGKWNPRGQNLFSCFPTAKGFLLFCFPNTRSSLVASLLRKLINSAHKHGRPFWTQRELLPGPWMGQPVTSLPRACSQLLNCCTLHLLQVVNSCRDHQLCLFLCPKVLKIYLFTEEGKEINPKDIICIGNTRKQSHNRHKTGEERGLNP